MFGVGMASCDEKKSDSGCIGFDDHIWDSIEAMMSKSKKTENNVCLKYHTFWSILHGLVSIKIMGNSSADRELNKMVLDDAIEGFLRNLK